MAPSQPILKVINLSKRYRIGAAQAQYSTLRESLTSLAQLPVRWIRNGRSYVDPTIWALDDVSFSVRAGEVVGIIGCNGAGKSTLLKVISRVTEPTKGRIELFGRLGSLLEVGTGFHPELTGRENIFLSGAILGMSRAEIIRKFDDIVAFAEVERFLDTPVKRYSSGMYVRLAFAVAAHLEPDIFLVDEVLSVGDMAFQKKCLQKITEMKKEATAILIVSHNMIAVRAVCERVIVLSNGQIVGSGPPEQAVSLYEKLMLESYSSEGFIDEQEAGMGQVRIDDVRLFDSEGIEKRHFKIGEQVTVQVEYYAVEHVRNPVVYAGIRRPEGFICVGSSTKLESVPLSDLKGRGVVEIQIPAITVLPGYYRMDVTFYDENFEFRNYFLGRRQIGFEVSSTEPSLDEKYGVFYQKHLWSLKQASDPQERKE